MEQIHSLFVSLNGWAVSIHIVRGYSSVGRALLLHGRCQRFESAYLHPHTKTFPVASVQLDLTSLTIDLTSQQAEREEIGRLDFPVSLV